MNRKFRNNTEEHAVMSARCQLVEEEQGGVFHCVDTEFPNNASTHFKYVRAMVTYAGMKIPVYIDKYVLEESRDYNISQFFEDEGMVPLIVNSRIIIEYDGKTIDTFGGIGVDDDFEYYSDDDFF